MRPQHFMTQDHRYATRAAADPIGREERRLEESTGINEAMVAMTHLAKAGAILKELGLEESFQHLTKAARSINKAYGR